MMKKALTVLAAVAALLLSTSVPASAEVVQIRGRQVLVDPETGRSTMSGDLVGDWYTTGFDVTGVQPSGTVQATGTEFFVGCWDRDLDGSCGAGDVNGWLSFRFRYSASAGGTGRCWHPVVDGGEGFAGAGGLLTFKDRVGQCGETYTTYSGHIDL